MDKVFSVVTPTYKRAGKVQSIGVSSNLKLVVRQSEAAEYKEHYPDSEIVQLPTQIIGLTMTRQWIYDYFGDVFMIDDDVVKCRRLYPVSRKASFCDMTPEETYELIQYTGNMALLAGCYLFGFNKNPNPLTYKPFVPIEMNKLINGCAIGMVSGSGLVFDNRFLAVEDFYISLLNYYKHRMAWIDMRFNFTQKDTFANVGGQQAYRTNETEKESTMLLRKTFGEVVSLKKDGYGGGSVRSKNKNKYGRTISIPL